MGTDYVVNVGPVAVVKNPARPGKKEHESCCNTQCTKYHRYAGTKFCEECGSQISTWEEDVVEPMDVDFYELLEEALVPSDCENSKDEVVILVPNDYSKKHEKAAEKVGFQSFNLKYGEECQVFPTPEEMTAFVKAFETTFDAELKKLRKVFGEENVSVRYGTIGVIC